MVKQVVNQDRTEVYKLEDVTVLAIKPVEVAGECVGYNLYIGQDLLGTFEVLLLAVEELQGIIEYDFEFYVISR